MCTTLNDRVNEGRLELSNAGLLHWPRRAHHPGASGTHLKKSMLGTTVFRWLGVGVTALSLVTWSSLACALDPSLDISKYGHAVWRYLDGFAPESIGPMAQTTDGYLWLGTPAGLLRFDGVRTVAWRPPAGSTLPDERIRALLGARDGTLWIGTMRGLVSLNDGRLTSYPSLGPNAIDALEEDADGTVWVGGARADWPYEGSAATALLCAVRKQSTECQDADKRFGKAIRGLYKDRAGAIWVAGIDTVWRLRPQPVLPYPLPERVATLRGISGTPDGAIVIGGEHSLLKVANDRVEAVPLPDWARGLILTKTLGDRDGGLWAGAADAGLLHVHNGRVDSYRSSDGLSGDHVLGLLEDREGNVWVATEHGLDQFRPMATATFSGGDGLAGRASSVLAARDGAVWVSSSKGLFRIDHGQVSAISPTGVASLFEDRRGRIWFVIPAGAVPARRGMVGYVEDGRLVPVPAIPPGWIGGIGEDSTGSIWFAHRFAGLVRLLPDMRVEVTPWSVVGESARVSAMAVDPRDDSLWLGLSGSVVNVHGGRVRSTFEVTAGDHNLGVGHIRVDPDGAVWVATRNDVTRIKDGRTARFDVSSGMPCNGAYWSQLDTNSVWLYTRCGLVEITRAEMDAWGAAADEGRSMKVKPRVLDQTEGVGVPGYASPAGGPLEQLAPLIITPKAARSPDGRIWLVTATGVAVLDPARVPRNRVIPPVHVEQITSDGTPYAPRADLRLPALTRDVRIDYTALSLTVPELVQFRYRLEGRDADWQDAGNRRQAFYTDLSPGRYRFSVIAANNSGLWNSKGDTLEFSVAPAWWQTNLFRVACACAVAIALYALYRLRVSRLSRQFNIMLDARVNERLRIARVLHDTLLQSFQGLLLRLQTALQLLPNGEGRRILAEGIDQAAEAITEGRDAVQGLRASATECQDLADALRSLGETLSADRAGSAVAFRVEVEGQPRQLHPLVRDDVFRIAAEALRNAFVHAAPTRVEIELRYGERHLRVRVRDDGKGMDAGVTRRGREGHFGLGGMRERAKLIGGKLALWSRLGAGTEVELEVPATLAYASAAEAVASGAIDDPAGQDLVATNR